jgi:hypothetical protein
VLLQLRAAGFDALANFINATGFIWRRWRQRRAGRRGISRS